MSKSQLGALVTIPTNSYHGLDFRGKIALNALDLNKNKLFPAESISSYQ